MKSLAPLVASRPMGDASAFLHFNLALHCYEKG